MQPAYGPSQRRKQVTQLKCGQRGGDQARDRAQRAPTRCATHPHEASVLAPEKA